MNNRNPCQARRCAHHECEACGIGHGRVIVVGPLCDSCRDWRAEHGDITPQDWEDDQELLTAADWAFYNRLMARLGADTIAGRRRGAA